MITKIYYKRTTQTDLSAQAYALLERVCGFKDEILRSEHGKPYFAHYPQLHFSLTHTRGLVGCAVSASPVGLDAEHPRVIRPALAARCFSERELQWAGENQDRLLELWTRKEAFLKYSGEGITRTLREVESLDIHQLSTIRVEGGFVLSICKAIDSEAFWQNAE